jgi:hypothetical protein
MDHSCSRLVGVALARAETLQLRDNKRVDRQALPTAVGKGRCPDRERTTRGGARQRQRQPLSGSVARPPGATRESPEAR